MRVLFTTLTTHRITEATEQQLRDLGATSIVPARELPARSIRLCPCCTGVSGVFMGSTFVYRVEFARPVTRREVARVLGVVRVRASLKTAPKGVDLEAAALPLPAPVKGSQMAPSSGKKTRQPRLSISQIKSWEKVRAIVPGLPEKVPSVGDKVVGEISTAQWSFSNGREFGPALRLFFKDSEARDWMLAAFKAVGIDALSVN